MAYTLKDYYDDVGASTTPFPYDVSEEADAPDEELFRTFYEECRAKWIADEKCAAENHIAELLPVSPEDAESLIARERAHALELRKEGLVGCFIAPDAPLRFDEAAAKRYFAALFRRRLAAVRREFPTPILPAVADIRLLALGVVSPRQVALRAISGRMQGALGAGRQSIPRALSKAD
jgi:hypothetical protein